MKVSWNITFKLISSRSMKFCITIPSTSGKHVTYRKADRCSIHFNWLKMTIRMCSLTNKCQEKCWCVVLSLINNNKQSPIIVILSPALDKSEFLNKCQNKNKHEGIVWERLVCLESCRWRFLLWEKKTNIKFSPFYLVPYFAAYQDQLGILKTL